jgi:enamine deaminase RidA (YjgF/YER057c/UK114 family)
LLNCLAVIKSVCSDLDQIEQVVKLTVFVNSADGFTNQPKVANGASELLLKIFGDAGKHVRSAVGVNELPIDAALEIEMVVKLK